MATHKIQRNEMGKVMGYFKKNYEGTYDGKYWENRHSVGYHFELNKVSFTYINNTEELQYIGVVNKAINPFDASDSMALILDSDNIGYYLINENEELFVDNCILEECDLIKNQVTIVGKQGFLISSGVCLVPAIKASSVSLT